LASAKSCANAFNSSLVTISSSLVARLFFHNS
jgi:hypothetical protein